ncbi:hypothetical protein CerSpe_011120 [Prunus speciosa]
MLGRRTCVQSEEDKKYTRAELEVLLVRENSADSTCDFKVKGFPYQVSCTIYIRNDIVAQADKGYPRDFRANWEAFAENGGRWELHIIQPIFPESHNKSFITFPFDISAKAPIE